MHNYVVSNYDLRIDPDNNNLSLWVEVTTEADVIYVDLNKIQECSGLHRKEYIKVKKLKKFMYNFNENKLTRDGLIHRICKLKNNPKFLYNP